MTLAEIDTCLNKAPYLEVKWVRKEEPLTLSDLARSIELGVVLLPLNAALPKRELEAHERCLRRFLMEKSQTSKELAAHGGLALLTSGSTGRPKLALFSWPKLLAAAEAQADALNVSSSSRWLDSLPLYHIAGVMAHLRVYVMGGSVTQDIESATHISWVPTQLLRFLNGPKKLPKLEHLIIGGAPVCPNLKRRAKNYPIFESYGLTEACALVSLNRRVLPHIDLKIIKGEVCLKGECLFLGYVDLDGSYFEQKRASWFKTGDLGKITASNELCIQGRIDNLFISGGENIQPEEIEASIEEHPEIQHACIIGVDDLEFGKRPVAFVSSSRELTLRELHTFLKGRLPKFKWPIRLLPWPAHVQPGKLARKHLKLEVLKSV